MFTASNILHLLAIFVPLLYDPFSIPCLAVIFFLQMPLKFVLHFINLSHLGAIFVLSHL